MAKYRAREKVLVFVGNRQYDRPRVDRVVRHWERGGVVRYETDSYILYEEELCKYSKLGELLLCGS